MSENTWPEQEAIAAWIKKHEIKVEPWQVLELTGQVSEHRIRAERKLDEKWEIGVRIVQLVGKCGDKVESRAILQTLNGDHVDRPFCWCNPKQDDEEETVWIHNRPEHDSDCSLHNAPAYPAGPCDCSIKGDGS